MQENDVKKKSGEESERIKERRLPYKKGGGSGKTIQEQMLEITGKNGNAQ